MAINPTLQHQFHSDLVWAHWTCIPCIYSICRPCWAGLTAVWSIVCQYTNIWYQQKYLIHTNTVQTEDQCMINENIWTSLFWTFNLKKKSQLHHRKVNMVEWLWAVMCLSFTFYMKNFPWPYKCLSCVYISDLNLVITVPADGLAPKGARPSAGTVMTSKLNTFLPSFCSYQWYGIKFNWWDGII